MGWWRCRFLVAGLLALTCASVQASSLSNLPSDRIIVKFKQSPNQAKGKVHSAAALQRLEQQRGVGANILRKMANGAHVVKLEKRYAQEELIEYIHQLRQDDDIEYAEPDTLMEPAFDPYYNLQWYLYEDLVGVNAQNAWAYSTGEGVVVAVLDTGVLPHEDLVDNLIPGYDFIIDVFTANDGDGRDADPSDPGDGVYAGACGSGSPTSDRNSTWHGSHVTGTLAATSDNGLGIHGIAYDSVVQPIRVLGRCGGYTSDIVDAIMWASGYSVAGVPDNTTPAQILNLSLSSSVAGACGQAYGDAISAANDAGVLVVVAAGNKSASADDYQPGNCTGAYTVAATGRYGGKAEYTNAGSVVDVAAPGGVVEELGDIRGIWSAVSSGDFGPENDSYRPKEGTSMAAPMVSATMALMLSAVPDASVEEIKQAIDETTQSFLGACAGCGSGILDAEEAVKRIMGLTTADAIADLGVVLKGDNGKFIEDPENANEGTIQYRVEVTNHGPHDAMDIDVGFTFPEEVTLQNLSGDTYMICNIDTFICLLNGLDVNQKATFTLIVRTEERGKMDFAASAYGADPDPDMENNYAGGRFGGALFIELLVLLVLLGLRVGFNRA